MLALPFDLCMFIVTWRANSHKAELCLMSSQKDDLPSDTAATLDLPLVRNERVANFHIIQIQGGESSIRVAA
jgi:hypothetical protein